MIFKKRTIKNIPKIFLSIVIILILDSGISFAQLFPNLGGQRSGTTSLQFLKIGTSARATGMAESYVAVSDDITSLYWNPAGLVSFKENGITASYTQWFVDTKLMNFGAVYHLDANNALGINVTSLSTEDMKVTTEYQPNGTGAYFRFSDLSFGLSYARQMTEQFSFGATIKYVNENLGELQMEGVLGDLATFYRTGLGTSRFAIMISNFGGQISPVGQVYSCKRFDSNFISEVSSSYKFPARIRNGAWMNKENG
ncbi:MAG: PorV/PorQ family protein [Ignavibacteria bacterium]